MAARPKLAGALSETARADDELLRIIFPDERRTWQCPHCAASVILTKDRVLDHIVEHPVIIVRETRYWRCPECNALADQESQDYVEPIEYISSIS